MFRKGEAKAQHPRPWLLKLVRFPKMFHQIAEKYFTTVLKNILGNPYLIHVRNYIQKRFNETTNFIQMTK